MIIYDLEIQKGILKKGEQPAPGIEYCDGWQDYGRMGISVAVTYCYERDEYKLFDEFMIDELGKYLSRADIVCGFNIFNFDNNLLASADINLDASRCYDLLKEIAIADKTPNNFAGLSLDTVSRANFSTAKTGHGAKAPILYQTKNFGELFDYCLNDVRLTKRLLDKIIRTGHITNPRNNNLLRVRRPF